MQNITVDGLENTVVARTALSRVDGESGRLIIGGRTLERLAEMDFDEVYRLLLPGAPDLGRLRANAFEKLLPILPLLRSLSPLRALRCAFSFLPDESAEADLVAAFPVAVAACMQGETLVAPDPSLSTAQDFAGLFFGRTLSPELVKALNTYLVTVCEHGMNASTFACRVVASTGARPIAAATAGLAALSGPLHGGAPGPVLDLLEESAEQPELEEYLNQKLRAGKRLMGFGHRVYRTRDPRAAVLKGAVESLGRSKTLEHAEKVEEAALGALSRHKPDRVLQTNVEFYTAVLLNEIGFGRDWFTPVFATGRILGWMAHYREQRAHGRLIRPKSEYVGVEP